MKLGTVRGKRQASEALLYICTAVAIGCCLHFVYREIFDLPMSLFDLRYELAALLGILLFVSASLASLFAQRLAYLLGLTVSLLAWPFFLLAEFSRYDFWNSWVALNMPGTHDDRTRLAGKLTIVVFIFLIFATSYSLLRLLPERWRLGQLAVRNRVWPLAGFTVAVVVVWFLSAVTPYRFPMYHRHQIGYPKLFLLHVEKHGLQLQETTLSILRDGRCYIRQQSRRLFQYSFRSELIPCYVPENVVRSARAIIDWGKSRGKAYPPYTPLRSWKSDKWFVYLDDPDRADIFNAEISEVPKEFLSWFDEAPKWSKESTWHDIGRDVCLGFCYDPTF